MSTITRSNNLAVIETHPVQYHAPVYRMLQERFDVPVTVIYGSDFSIRGYEDSEFGEKFSWDTDLLSGYNSVFLSSVKDGGEASYEDVSASGLSRALMDINPKAVMLVGYSPRFHQFAFYNAWRIKRPILFRAETTDHAYSRGIIKSWLRDKMLQWMYRRCHRLLYIGNKSFRHYKRLGIEEERLVFSPYCVDDAPFETDESSRERMRDRTRKELGIGEEKIVLLFSGKIVHRKGPDLIIHAVKTLEPRIREKLVVVFLGSGSEEKVIIETADCDPQVNTVFLGFKNQTFLSQYYHAADLFVLPSRYGETWGLVVNEALHHGLPCVVSDGIGCAADLIEEGVTGNVFVSEDVSSLANVIVKSLKLMRNLQVRLQCREKVSNYTVEKAAEGISTAFNSLD